MRVKSTPGVALETVLAGIAAGACERDRFPAFPAASLDALEAAGVLRLSVPGDDGRRSVSLAEEWRTVRRVAAADASVARVLDGHLNAVERIDVTLPEPLRSEELRAVSAGERRLGVWGADPVPGEGEPARLTAAGCAEGVKVFCSGAGGLDRALVLLHADEPGRRCSPTSTSPRAPRSISPGHARARAHAARAVGLLKRTRARRNFRPRSGF